MPVVPPAIVGLLFPNMASTGNIGGGVAKFASGVAGGLAVWIPKIQVITIDSGSLGVGSGGPMPLVVPSPLLYANLLTGSASFGILGPMDPLLELGLANGLMAAFTGMLVKTTHPGVGVGAATAKFQAPPAIPDMIAGFSAAGLVGDGPVKKASAVGMALDITFASLVMPVPIVGAPSPSGGAGAGFGQII